MDSGPLGISRILLKTAWLRFRCLYLPGNTPVTFNTNVFKTKTIFTWIPYPGWNKINFLVISHNFNVFIFSHMLLSSAKLEVSNLSTTKLFLEILMGDQLKASTCFSPLNWEFYLQLLGYGLLNVWCMINQGEGTWDNGRKRDSVDSFLCGFGCSISSLHLEGTRSVEHVASNTVGSTAGKVLLPNLQGEFLAEK